MSFADVKGIRTFYREYGNPKDADVLYMVLDPHRLYGGIFPTRYLWVIMQLPLI